MLRGLRRGALSCASVLIPVVAGCDLEVTNPAVLEDESIDDPEYVPALVRSVRGSLSHMTAGGNSPTGWGLYVASSLLSDELVHSGLDPDFRGFSDGRAVDDWSTVEKLWADASQSRFMAHDLIDRLDRMIPVLEADAAAGDSSRIGLLDELKESRGETLVWAGFINRAMGDHFCNAVTDQGLEPHTAYYEKADSLFTRVIELAETDSVISEWIPVAFAGRAQARMLQGHWADAVVDATMQAPDPEDPEASPQALVPADFAFQQMHLWEHAREANAFRRLTWFPKEITLWGTPFGEWGEDESGNVGGYDPRIDYRTVPGAPHGTILESGDDERRPYWRQLKYSAADADIDLVSGTEMLLLRAEADLLNGEWPAAMAKIQQIRAHRGLADDDVVAVSNLDQAWELLMKERGIELWLEGRRLADLRRWAVTPGSVPFEVVREAGPGDASTDVARNVLEDAVLCIPISRREKETNPKI